MSLRARTDLQAPLEVKHYRELAVKLEARLVDLRVTVAEKTAVVLRGKTSRTIADTATAQ